MAGVQPRRCRDHPRGADADRRARPGAGAGSLSPPAPRELPVPPNRAGERLDAFLAGPLGSRAAAQRAIDEDRVRVEGRPRPKRHLLRAGERVTVAAPAAAPAPADLPTAPPAFAIAYEDDALLVVDKPAGLVVHPARGHRENTLAQALEGRAAGGEPGRAGIVHRLDRDTSGLLVVARTPEAHRALRRDLQARRIQREYLALVEGRPPARSGTVEAPIGRDRRHRTRMSLDTDRPREARTHFRLERALPRASLLRVNLETGRTHQIRVHLQAIGHPVAGDPEYGARPGLYGLGRQFLHATRLAFDHPVSGEPVDVCSPLPADLQTALEAAAAER